MYFLTEKRLVVVLLMMVWSLSLFSQKESKVVDTLIVQQDTVKADTLGNWRRPSPSAIDKRVTFSAAGYKKNDIAKKTITLVESAQVTYDDLEIKADSMVFNMNTNILHAEGRADSTGKKIGTPVFKQGSEEFEAEEIMYNFKTKKALVKNIVTKQADGLLHSQFTKLLEDGTSNISKSSYSTCDADTPHFYINMPKARVYPGEKIVSGPGNLVLEGIPLPLVIPFGYFPIQTKKAASGILIPSIGQTNELGYSLTEGGYYFALSDYFDLSLTGNMYTNGTWMGTAKTSYNKLYKYSGNFSFSYSNNISGYKGLPNYSKSNNYKVMWTYTQSPKASPSSTFSASVNMTSSGFDKKNSYNVADHITTTRASSISYSKSWDGTPFNMSASMNHSQNVANNTVYLNLPKVNFNVGRIYPLKGKKSSGTTKWYQELQLQYSSSLDNQINTKDSLLFTNKVWDNMKNGFKHDIPLSIQLRPFNNFSISPQLSYKGVMYTQKIEEKWDPDYVDEEGKAIPSVVVDTTKGIYYGHAINPSISMGFNPQIYGTYLFTNPNSRWQAVRHVIKPSIGFNYVPYMKGLSSKMYHQVQKDTLGNMRNYSMFEGSIYGTPSLSSRSGSVSFGLINILEAKVFARNDTTGKPNKVKLIDNLGINTSYNIFADSMRWSPVAMSFRTTLLENINISANSNFSLYGTDSEGNSVGTFLWEQNRKLMRLTSFSTSLDFSLSDLISGKKDKKGSGSSQSTASQMGKSGFGMSGPSGQQQQGAQRDDYGYSVFDIPWSCNMSYNFSYTKSLLKSKISQTLSVNGSVTLTKKMAMTYTSGYDFDDKEITMTQIGITRDLHCWEMRLNWVPNGTMQSWNFTIRVKASVLGDLKYERRKDYHDSY
ncbi:MAG TPA: putative LPS assembly protein LptD [Bacteroidales bacterium]|nr:putative LPS assembly protein LptD [Bacteroidales bacterium]